MKFKTTTMIFMGDIWKPRAQWDSRYLWRPLEIGDGKLWLSEPKEWTLDIETGEAVIKNQPAETNSQMTSSVSETEKILPGSTGTTAAINIEADAKMPGKSLIHFWNACVGAGRANEGLRASWLEQLKLVHDECGFQYVRFLNALGDEVIAKTNGIIVTRNKSTGKLTALIYNYPSEVKMSLPTSSSLAAAFGMLAKGSPMPVNITLDGLSASVNVLVETLDKTHGNAVVAWEAMGKPEPPTRGQSAELRKAAMAVQQETFHADATGQFVLERQIEPGVSSSFNSNSFNLKIRNEET